MCYLCKSKMRALEDERQDGWQSLLKLASNSASSDKDIAALARSVARTQQQIAFVRDMISTHERQERAEAGERPTLPKLDKDDD